MSNWSMNENNMARVDAEEKEREARSAKLKSYHRAAYYGTGEESEDDRTKEWVKSQKLKGQQMALESGSESEYKTGKDKVLDKFFTKKKVKPENTDRRRRSRSRPKTSSKKGNNSRKDRSPSDPPSSSSSSSSSSSISSLSSSFLHLSSSSCISSSSSSSSDEEQQGSSSPPIASRDS